MYDLLVVQNSEKLRPSFGLTLNEDILKREADYFSSLGRMRKVISKDNTENREYHVVLEVRIPTRPNIKRDSGRLDRE